MAKFLSKSPLFDRGEEDKFPISAIYIYSTVYYKSEHAGNSLEDDGGEIDPAR